MNCPPTTEYVTGVPYTDFSQTKDTFFNGNDPHPTR